MNTSPPFSKLLIIMNKNLRPYCISIDWLQLHLHRASHFCAEKPEVRSFFASPEDSMRFTFQKLHHGSKTYAEIYLIRQFGTEWAELSLSPYSHSINPLSCTLKLKNKVLYEPNLMQHVADFIELFEFRYLGLTRLDLAYDCNEFYGGLLPQRFMHKYENGDIIKFGSGAGYRQFTQGYALGWDKNTSSFSLTADIAIPEKHSTEGSGPTDYELEVERQKIYKAPGTLIKLPDERNPLKGGRPLTEKCTPLVYTSTTWGSRSSGHQVQLYNKTMEMQQVAYKHHIAQRWQDYGLDLERDVWRLEIRITKGARLLENQLTGKQHLLDPRDLLCEEQIEQLFWDYSYKYFRFYCLDTKDRRTADGKKQRSLMAMLAHKDRLKQYRIFSCAERNSKGELTESLSHVFVPRTPKPQQDYTRAVRQAVNVLQGAIRSQADAKDPAIVHTQEAVRHLERVYGIERRRLFEEREFRARVDGPASDYEIFNFYREHWSDVEKKWFVATENSSAALSWARVNGATRTAITEELKSFGYNVHPIFADVAMEELLDTGCVSEAYLMHSSAPYDDDLPFSYYEPEPPSPFETS